MLHGKIILYTYHKSTQKGYPVKIKLSDGKLKRTRYVNTGYYAHERQWKVEDPAPGHPQYNEMMLDILDWRKKLFTLLPRANREGWSLDKLLLQFNRKSDFDIWSFIDQMENVSERTKEIYRSAVHSYQRFAGHFRIESIDSVEVERYIEHQLKTQSNNGLNIYLGQLKAAINKAIKLGHYTGTNPFKGKSVPSERTPNKALSLNDLIKIRNADFEENSQRWHHRNYYLLMFYLGGIDLVDLAHLRYDEHLVGGRVEFRRHKGGTNEFVSNAILPQAKAILELYDCKPYFVPIFSYKNYRSFSNNFCGNFPRQCKGLELSRPPKPKSARYSFINRAKELLIDERITMELVGHARKGTHSIYQDNFPFHVRDDAHRQIIGLD